MDNLVISRRAESPGTRDIVMPPVCPSVWRVTVPFSFRTVTIKLKNTSLYFLETLQVLYYFMGVCCIVFDIDGMLFEFFMNFLNMDIYIYIYKIVVLASEPVGGRSRATELPCF